jgi:hypothetical protein
MQHIICSNVILVPNNYAMHLFIEALELKFLISMP